MIISDHARSHKKHTECGEDYQKAEIECRELKYIFSCFTGIKGVVLPERDKACKRRYKRADAADIHTEQKTVIIACKLRQQDSRRYIADKLA